MIPIIGAIGTALVTEVSGWFKRRQEIKKAETDNRVRMLKDEQDHNHEWEMRQLTNAGWKDDVLFFAIIGLWIWSAIDPEGAKVVFQNWEDSMPEYIVEITSWLVAAVLGVKKIGDYLPGAIKGIRGAMK